MCPGGLYPRKHLRTPVVAGWHSWHLMAASKYMSGFSDTVLHNDAQGLAFPSVWGKCRQKPLLCGNSGEILTLGGI